MSMFVDLQVARLVVKSVVAIEACGFTSIGFGVSPTSCTVHVQATPKAAPLAGSHIMGMFRRSPPVPFSTKHAGEPDTAGIR